MAIAFSFPEDSPVIAGGCLNTVGVGSARHPPSSVRRQPQLYRSVIRLQISPRPAAGVAAISCLYVDQEGRRGLHGGGGQGAGDRESERDAGSLAPAPLSLSRDAAPEFNRLHFETTAKLISPRVPPLPEFSLSSERARHTPGSWPTNFV